MDFGAELNAYRDGYTGMGRGPSMRRYVELPIIVRHSWEGYPLVDQALAALEQGQFQEAALLSDAVFTDDRVIGCLSTRINGLFGLPMEFKWPGQDKANASSKPAGPDAPTQRAGEEEDEDPYATELKQQIAELAERNWERMFPGAARREQMRWGILLNMGLGELVWDWGRDGLIWPTLKTWNPQFIYWRWDTRSYFLIHQEGQIEVHPGDGRWVLFSPTGHNHGWLYGLIRSLGKLWLDRVFAFKDWARASEKFSLGIIKAKGPANGNKDDKARFEAQVTNLTNESTIFLPQGKKDEASYDLEMMETDDMVHPDFYVKRIHQLDVSIAVCLLGQNLSTEITGQGSRAAAQVHDNVRGDFLKADDEVWSSMVRTQVLTPWVRHNWGDIIESMGRNIDEFVPYVRHKVEPPEDMEKKSKALAAVGAAIPNLAGTDADIHAILDDFGIATTDQKAVPDDPPPADANERPPGPASEDEEHPSTPTTENAAARIEVAARQSRRQELKPGQRKAHVMLDDLVAGAKKAAVAAMAHKRRALVEIIRTSQDFDEMKQRIKTLYFDSKPSELRSVLEKSLAAAQLFGRMAVHVDHKRDLEAAP